LSQSAKPIGSHAIADRLKLEGIQLDERTIRYHLKMADARGYTQSLSSSAASSIS
jgi:repressor of nif and glnA expression